MNKAFFNFVGLKELMVPQVKYVNFTIPLKIREDVLHDLRIEYQQYVVETEHVSDYPMNDSEMVALIALGIMVGEIPLCSEETFIDTEPETLETLKYIDMVSQGRASLA